MKKAEKRVIESAAEMFSLPGDALGLLRAELIGDRRLVVENHKGIVSCGRDCIEISGGATLLTVRGEELEICAMTRHEIAVAGCIGCIEITRR